MKSFELERHGRILEGFYEGYFVKLHDDSENTGGFYILIVDDLVSPTDGGDYWVKDMAELELFVDSSRWKVKWL
ncbi:hypothetical protein GCM10010112_91020 [Actinoplanes lobatus]|uniref:Uncharacterized protein n=1 Tax=Actinoplanes lobatus TaxID=113568 RepID=A0A7W7HK84_9ACTN|nr:hypothetical protein [Actinoplanes lobatus]MBB4752060.1 hypothetical protein [Actinoplanes lobatus]GGN98179.1 hypothetical protein GCM10010112_91020 [Actinoplanes lobatus]GIE45886.1 hypothetical protein Alo02nite_87840 [Actinoplanes lobatus]